MRYSIDAVSRTARTRSNFSSASAKRPPSSSSSAWAKSARAAASGSGPVGAGAWACATEATSSRQGATTPLVARAVRRSTLSISDTSVRARHGEAKLVEFPPHGRFHRRRYRSQRARSARRGAGSPPHGRHGVQRGARPRHDERVCHGGSASFQRSRARRPARERRARRAAPRRRSRCTYATPGARTAPGSAVTASSRPSWPRARRSRSARPRCGSTWTTPRRRRDEAPRDRSGSSSGSRRRCSSSLPRSSASRPRS